MHALCIKIECKKIQLCPKNFPNLSAIYIGLLQERKNLKHFLINENIPHKLPSWIMRNFR